MITAIALIIAFFSLLYLYNREAFHKYLERVKLARKLDGPPSVFPFGTCLLLRKQTVLNEEFAEAYERYPALTRIWISIFPTFVFLDPKDIQIVLSSKKHTDKMFLYKFLHNFLGKGLITSNGDRWTKHRKLMQPYFHISILEKFIPTFAFHSERIIQKMAETKGDLDVTKFVNQCILNVLNGK